MNDKIIVTNSIRVIYGLGLFAVATAANAVPVYFVRHNQSSGITINTLTSDGSSLSLSFPAAYGGLPGAVTASFDWDGTTLTSTGKTLGYPRVGPL